jgi:beta-N-acetylhexosaminidase
MKQVKASELFIVGFDGLTLTKKVSAFLSHQNLGGFILFKRNIESLEQLVTLNAEIINSNLINPPLLSVDQEGGRVARLRGICTDIPPLSELTLKFLQDPQLCFRLGASLGRELVALGFHLNFAPVCDIAIDQSHNDIIGDRSFSHEAHTVATLVEQMINGMQSSGLAACAKHFPGHGSTILDSHHELPTVATDQKTMRERELVPFKAAIRAQVATIMTAHIIAEAFDKKYPATMSGQIIEELLRHELGFNEVVISDDLDMKAVADHYDLGEIIEHSLMASVDMFIIGNNWDKSEEAIAITQRLIDSNDHIRQKALAAKTRIDLLRARYIGKALAPSLEYAQSIVRCAPHVELIEACR